MFKPSTKWVVTTLVAAVVIALALVGGVWNTGQAATTPTTPTTPTLPTVPTVPGSGTFTTTVNPDGDLVLTLVSSAFEPNNLYGRGQFTPSNAPVVQASSALADILLPIPSSAVTTDQAANTTTVTLIIPNTYITQTGTLKISLINNYGLPGQVEFGNWTLNIVKNTVYFSAIVRNQ